MVAIRWHRLSIGVLGGAIVGGLLISGVALAGHNEPKEAKEFKTSLVRAFAACTAPNDFTLNPGLPACMPAIPEDSVCLIDPVNGFGELLVQVLNGDVKIQVIVDKMIGCDGETLDAVATVQVTTDNCAFGADCTSVVVPDLPVASCVVSGGKCEIDTTVNTVMPGSFVVGDNVGIEVLGCGLKRTTLGSVPLLPAAQKRTFSCGILVK